MANGAVDAGRKKSQRECAAVVEDTGEGLESPWTTSGVGGVAVEGGRDGTGGCSMASS